ncbi:predicted protein [Streptomyces sp. SPB78]|nr:predicted protein [Streptomyces sp. SPB78]
MSHVTHTDASRPGAARRAGAARRCGDRRRRGLTSTVAPGDGEARATARADPGHRRAPLRASRRAARRWRVGLPYACHFIDCEPSSSPARTGAGPDPATGLPEGARTRERE